MSDIVERLRDPQFDCAEEAADEIERLRAENAKLKEYNQIEDEQRAAAAARSMRERAKPAIKAALKKWEDDMADDREQDTLIDDTIDALPLIEDKP